MELKKFLEERIRPLVSGKLLFLYGIILMYSFVNRMLTSPLTTYGLSMGLSGFALGMIQNGVEFTCMAGRPLAGYCIDSNRKKLALLGGFALMMVTAVIFALVKSPLAYGLARLFQGFVTAFMSSVMNSILPSEVPTSRIGTVMAISSALTNLGSSYAPGFAKSLFTNHGFHTAYLVTAVSAMVVLLAVAPLRLEQSQKPTESKKEEKGILSGLSAAVLPVCTLGLFANITKDVNEFYTVQLGLDRGIDVTTGIAIAGTMAIFIGILAGIAIDRFKPYRVLVPAFTFLAISCFLYSHAQTTTEATAAAILYRIGIGAYWPALMAQCCYVLPHRKGAAIATLYFFLDVVSLLNNTLLGYLYDRVGAAPMYRVVGIINLCAVAYFLLLRRVMPSIRKEINTKNEGEG